MIKERNLNYHMLVGIDRQTPQDLSHNGLKYVKKATQLYGLILQSPDSTLGLLPSIALSFDQVFTVYHNDYVVPQDS